MGVAGSLSSLIPKGDRQWFRQRYDFAMERSLAIGERRSLAVLRLEGSQEFASKRRTIVKRGIALKFDEHQLVWGQGRPEDRRHAKGYSGLHVRCCSSPYNFGIPHETILRCEIRTGQHAANHSSGPRWVPKRGTSCEQGVLRRMSGVLSRMHDIHTRLSNRSRW